MGRLVYSLTVSLDGYVNDAEGDFDFAAPDEEVHAFVNSSTRGIGTFLFGRRMYETMRVWDDLDVSDEPVMAEFAAVWADAEKVVFSTSLGEVDMRRTTLERTFDADEMRRFVEASPRDVGIGGPTLAAAAFRAGLIDEVQLYVVPYLVGGGTRALPDGVRAELELVDEYRFAGGTVALSYRVSRYE